MSANLKEENPVGVCLLPVEIQGQERIYLKLLWNRESLVGDKLTPQITKIKGSWARRSLDRLRQNIRSPQKSGWGDTGSKGKGSECCLDEGFFISSLSSTEP